MKINSVEFVMSAGNARECPEGALPEIAVSGRSNVGKSSLMNSLFGRKDLVMVSATPGKTQRLNYFLVNEKFHIVDLPGYGFAKAPPKVREQWARMMQEFLRTRRQLVAMIQLVDVRHDPSREDREMVRWLLDERMPFCLVATKTDKLASSKREPAMRAIATTLELPADQPMVGYSSHAGEGRPALLAWVGQALSAGE
ncbi:MAG: YihA family ribosome biogenesis GTP-binding protein [Candidatus Eisenbacteria bacterium]|uniref:Probable GTP-binding protein EngB n=1 Tax=Eiseniibacteriota bacterium TaxID=2212470 RepID=A0A849SUU0_UNCEI|nr:YihA family ribosome biogenesis GTP-binding protein [Candidatus Eisenbacteria bacterium]